MEIKTLGEKVFTTGRVGPGGIAAILRCEGVYSLLLTDWCRQQDAGAYEVL